MNQNSNQEFSSFQGREQSGSKRLAVILAGGDGTRLRTLTRAIAGDERPKQFCPILDDETLLDKTRRRIALAIKPENTFFSLTKKHELFYSRPLWNVPEKQKVVQPENRGTAPAILYSLMRIVRSEPDATVAFFPSDHYFSDDDGFMQSVDSAFRTVSLEPNSVLLLGVEPENPEVSYGWIEPSKSLFGDMPGAVSRVARFWEKPGRRPAKRLMAGGALWNSFVMVGRVATFLSLFERFLPEIYRMFVESFASMEKTNEAAAVRSLYARIGESNFSSDVLERAVERLLVMRVGGVGWSDWGEPQRVLGTLSNLGIQTEWMRAVAA
jgi:mannose-1-phosphate guanylyltransferase